MAYGTSSVLFYALKQLNKDNSDSPRALSWQRNQQVAVRYNATRKAPQWLLFTLVAHRTEIRCAGGRRLAVLVVGICTMELSRYPVSGRRCIVIAADAAAAASPTRRAAFISSLFLLIVPLSQSVTFTDSLDQSTELPPVYDESTRSLHIHVDQTLQDR